MKLVVVMGTHRKHGAGAHYVSAMLEAARGMPGVEAETLWLGDYDIRQCRGCMACYDLGEVACPLRDGYLGAMRVLNEADAAVFYSPTYSLSISGTMKAFFDRSSYVLHRPYFKGRRALVLTAAAAWGQKPALGTLRRIVSMMGFDIVGAHALSNTRYERDPRYTARIGSALRKGIVRLVRQTQAGELVRPKMLELIAFQMQKPNFCADTPGCRSDKRFWRTAGWSEKKAVFYCKARISPVKAMAAKAIALGLRKTGLLPM